MADIKTPDNIARLHGTGSEPGTNGTTEASPAPRTPPQNEEAEMQLLGALLANNRAYEKVQDFLRPEQFANSTHGRIYAACETLIDRGQLASPVTLKNYFEQDQSLEDVGGPLYLARLAASVSTIQNAHDLARVVYDCFLRRELIDIGEEVVNSAFEQDFDRPPDSQIEEAEERLYSLAEKGVGANSVIDFKTAVTEALRSADAAYKRDSHLVGISTGFTDLDRLLGGLHNSDLLIVAGRPSMGKTAFATNLSFNAANTKSPKKAEDGTEVTEREVVAFFSLEMSSEQLATRIISTEANVRSDKIRRGDIDQGEYDRIFATSQTLHGLPLYIDDTPALSVSALRTRARRLKRQQGLSLIVVDYLQLMTPSANARKENRVQEVSEITRGLKAVAKELDVPVVALSQLSRAVEQREDKRPLLSDLRESGSIEQDADVVMFLYREEYYRSREIPTQRDGETDEKFDERRRRHLEIMSRVANKAEVIIAKQRHGPIGIVNLEFEGDFTRFTDYVDPERMPELR
ncbi:MAG: replicative DNA helicase [Alphaproteobacteria bacterium]|nr:replicative DNA helicase [Alphaproteobacteria bacterium]